MAFAVADVKEIGAPYIGGAMPSSARTPNNLFASPTSIGGTSVRGVAAPARQEPGRSDRMSVPTMDHVVETAGKHTENGVTGFGNLVGTTIDNASQFGIVTTAGVTALSQMGFRALQDSITTQGPSYTFGDVQPPAPAPETAALEQARMYQQHLMTVAKQGLIKAGVSFDNVALTDADLNSFQDLTQTISEAREFAQNKQTAGMAVA